jgi:hypothetical protein
MARVDGVIDESWRERAVDAEALAIELAEGESAIAACRADVARLNDELRQADLGRALQRHARVLELAAREDEARACLSEALSIWRALGRASAAFLTTLKLAALSDDTTGLARQYARTQTEEALAPYEDTAALYLGCALARAGEVDGARRALEAALVVRKRRGKAAPIEEIEGLLARLADGTAR